MLDPEHAPVTNATVFIKELRSGTTTDIEGRYFLTLQPGSYEMVFSSIGYESKSVFIVLREKDRVVNVTLKPSLEQLDELVITAKRRDPAYDIIKKTIANRDKYQNQVKNSKTTLYVKAVEEIEIAEKEKKKEPIISFGIRGEPDISENSGKVGKQEATNEPP